MFPPPFPPPSKEREIGQLQQKAEEDQSVIATLQKKIRELEARIEELEEDLENERSLRSRVSHYINRHLHRPPKWCYINNLSQ